MPHHQTNQPPSRYATIRHLGLTNTMKKRKIIFGLECRDIQNLATVLEKILNSKNHCDTSPDSVLRAAANPEFRALLLTSRELNSQAVKTLLNLRHQEGRETLDPSSFTNINNITMYFQALRAFPLIQNHYHFDKLHLQTKLYFLLRESSLFYPNEKLPVGLLSSYAGVSRVTIHYWLKGTFRPRLLGLLERRAATLPIHQHRAEFLPAVPTNRVAAATALGQKARHRLENKVAGRMPVNVVDPLEEIEVDHHAR